eukprot:Hpha_TRINITY_DN15327_c7_g2::TRINITY_DN15327_c7_g2_i3::g.91110::m.91110
MMTFKLFVAVVHASAAMGLGAPETVGNLRQAGAKDFARAQATLALVFKEYRAGGNMVEVLGVTKHQATRYYDVSQSGRQSINRVGRLTVKYPMQGVLFGLRNAMVGGQTEHCVHRNMTHVLTWNRRYNRKVAAAGKPGKLIKVERLDQAVSMVHHECRFWQHFIMNDLPRVPLACPFLNTPGGLTAKVILCRPYQVELFRMVCPIDPGRFVILDESSAPPHGVWAVARELYVPEWQYEGDQILGYSTREITRGEEVPRPAPFQARPLMAMYPPYILKPVGYEMHKRVVWLSRGTERRRGIQNEAEILAGMRKVLPYGWRLEVFADGEHNETFSAMREFFATAAIIIGPHGGSFANAFFLPVGATVIEINGMGLKDWGGGVAPNPKPCFFGLAMTLGLEYRLISPEHFRHSQRILVDVDSVLAALPFPAASKLSQAAVEVVTPKFPKGGWNWYI